jgi:phospholipid/cholesterol/gamma-HCH transport system ATP-binding protein
MENVSFRIPRGTIFGLTGGPGCGSNKLMRSLVGLEQPRGGRIHIAGVGAPNEIEGIPPFGAVFQSGALFSSMTLAENLELPLVT